MQAEKKFEHSRTPYFKLNFTYYIISKIDAGWEEIWTQPNTLFELKF
jgi:hypothetical protein